MTVNDLKHAKLLTLTGGLSGHIDDLERIHLTSLGAESWQDYAIQQGFPGVGEWLASLGHTGTVNDMWYQYWSA